MKKKKPLKIFGYEDIAKDYGVSFIAGIMGGITVLVLGLAIKSILNKNIFDAGKWFLFYVIIEIFTFLAGFMMIKKLFINNAKKR